MYTKLYQRRPTDRRGPTGVRHVLDSLVPSLCPPTNPMRPRHRRDATKPLDGTETANSHPLVAAGGCIVAQNRLSRNRGPSALDTSVLSAAAARGPMQRSPQPPPPDRCTDIFILHPYPPLNPPLCAITTMPLGCYSQRPVSPCDWTSKSKRRLFPRRRLRGSLGP